MNSEAKKLIVLNALIYLGLLFIPPTFFWIYKTIKLASAPSLPHENLNLHPAYPTEKDKLEAKAMEEDSKNVKTQLEFRSFIGWRRLPYSSKYSNVKLPYNTRHSHNSNLDNSVWFFGGSTMWGTGAPDHETIPSWYAKEKNVDVHNFGETAWTSRQSLNQLLNLLGDGHKPSRIVFYDGVNDIIHGCRAELPDVPAHTQEPLIRSRLQPFIGIVKDQFNDYYKKVSDYIAAPYKAIGGKLGFYAANHQPYGSLDCSSNTKKARLVASHLVNNWYAAYLLAKAQGAEFMAVLQPHIFSTKNVDLSYLNNSEFYLKSEHNSVYPIIKQQIKQYCSKDLEFCESVIDGSAWLDSRSPVYLDFAHITGKGNQIISGKIIQNE